MMSHPKTVKKVQVSATDQWDQADTESQPIRGQSCLDVPPQDWTVKKVQVAAADLWIKQTQKFNQWEGRVP